ncbi:MAG: porin [Endozoicomonas sp. (ex Botrylloides leachii)]|nr:porin [Endozoicomonas sp. (ex Botrylloides leachii)]
MQKRLLATVISSLIASQAMAVEAVNPNNQKIDSGTQTTVYTDHNNTLAIGGRIGIQTETKDKKTSPGNDSSRLNLSFAHKISDQTTGFAVAEWGYTPHNEYKNVNGKTEAGDTFSNRLGYLGIKNDKWGALSFGKQWSVYYDIAGWTDQYAIGGGQAMGVYNGFTDDGGFSGTGRADAAIDYRGTFFHGLNVGAQYQLRDTNYDESNTSYSSGDVKRTGGYQVALSYDLPMGLSVGATYNETNFDATQLNSTSLNGLKSRATVGGIKFHMNDLYLAGTYGQFENHTAATYGFDSSDISGSVLTPFSSNVAYNMSLDRKSRGIELYGRYRLSQLLDGGISLETGWNKLDVQKDNMNNDSDAKLDKAMVGAIYEVGSMQFAAEYIWNNSKYKDVATDAYKNGENYFNLQARYYF